MTTRMPPDGISTFVNAYEGAFMYAHGATDAQMVGQVATAAGNITKKTAAAVSALRALSEAVITHRAVSDKAAHIDHARQDRHIPRR